MTVRYRPRCPLSNSELGTIVDRGRRTAPRDWCPKRSKMDVIEGGKLQLEPGIELRPVCLDLTASLQQLKANHDGRAGNPQAIGLTADPSDVDPELIQLAIASL